MADAPFVKRVEQIVPPVYFERLFCNRNEGRGENDFGEWDLLVQELLDDPKAVKPGHLDIQENQVWIVFFDEVHGFEAVFALSNDIDVAGALEQIRKLIAGELLIVHDYRG